MKTKRFSVITSLLIVVFLSLMTMTGALADRILYLDSSASITIPNTFKYSKKESGITFYSDSRSSIEMLYEALDFKLTLSQMKTVVSTNGFSNISVETNGNGVTYVLGHKLLSATQAEAVACFSSKNSTILLMIIYNPFKDSELTTTAKVLVSIKVASQTPSVPTPKPTATPTPTPTNNPLPAGWNQLNGNWYFVDNTGSYTVGWAKLNEKWYLFDNNGKMLTGWQQNNGNWYFFDGSGAMQTGWLQSGGVWYYLDSSGVMAKGWKEIQEGKTKTWYYFKADGAMVTDWQIIDGKWELFSSSGAWQYSGNMADASEISGQEQGKKDSEPQSDPSEPVQPAPKPYSVDQGNGWQKVMCADSVSFMIPSSYEHSISSYYTNNTDPDLTLKLINDYYHRRAGQHDIVGSINYSLYRKNASNKGAIEYVIGNEAFQKRTTAKGLEVYWKGNDSIHVYIFTKNYIIELYFRDDEPSINQAIFETVDYN